MKVLGLTVSMVVSNEQEQQLLSAAIIRNITAGGRGGLFDMEVVDYETRGAVCACIDEMLEDAPSDVDFTCHDIPSCPSNDADFGKRPLRLRCAACYTPYPSGDAMGPCPAGCASVFQTIENDAGRHAFAQFLLRMRNVSDFESFRQHRIPPNDSREGSDA